MSALSDERVTPTPYDSDPGTPAQLVRYTMVITTVIRLGSTRLGAPHDASRGFPNGQDEEDELFCENFLGEWSGRLREEALSERDWHDGTCLDHHHRRPISGIV